MNKAMKAAAKIAENIQKSGLDIYSPLNDRPDLYLSNEQIELLLCNSLAGLSLDLPLHTRSKVAKAAVCTALGYPVPKSFKRMRPRFFGQNFDLYVQKADNLQIWNEQVSASRRYVVIRVDEKQVVAMAKVISGEALAALDTTGTLTQKYQAAARNAVTKSVLVSDYDTPELQQRLIGDDCFWGNQARFRDVMPVSAVFAHLQSLIGARIPNPGHEQERNRGAGLHAVVQKALGGAAYADTGQFPDVIGQLIEVKLQTSPTVDLGLVSPEHTDPVASIPNVRHCDVRYAVVYGHLDGSDVVLDHVVVSTGKDFFNFFRKFEGKKINKKLQIRLPKDFFSQCAL